MYIEIEIKSILYMKNIIASLYMDISVCLSCIPLLYELKHDMNHFYKVKLQFLNCIA